MIFGILIFIRGMIDGYIRGDDASFQDLYINIGPVMVVIFN